MLQKSAHNSFSPNYSILQFFFECPLFFESHDSPQHSTFTQWKLIQPGPVNMMTLAGQTARVSTQQQRCNCSLEGSFLTSTFRFLHEATSAREWRWLSKNRQRLLRLTHGLNFMIVQSHKCAGVHVTLFLFTILWGWAGAQQHTLSGLALHDNCWQHFNNCKLRGCSEYAKIKNALNFLQEESFAVSETCEQASNSWWSRATSQHYSGG